MEWRMIGKALLFPRAWVMILLVPISVVLLVGSMVFVGTRSAIACISYALAAYTLTVWCFKIPNIIKLFKTFKDKNKYVRRWRDDTRLRVNVSLYGSLIWNAFYGIFQLWLGFYHHTFWFWSLGAYYICLGVMRFLLLLHTRRYNPGERMYAELVKYRACGCAFLVMNTALAVVIFFMVYWNRTFEHHEITAIAMAAYTFAALTAAIINVIKYRKYNSPIYSASKAISLAAAFVSMLTLESTMLTTFGEGNMALPTRKLFLALSGAVISILIVAMSVYMIVYGTKKLKTEVKNGKQ